MRRAFTKGEKQIIWLKGKGICGICGWKVRKGDPWHADHIYPYILGGATIIENGQIAHPECNNWKKAKVLDGSFRPKSRWESFDSYFSSYSEYYYS